MPPTGSTASSNEAAPSLTDADVIAAIRAKHLKANIGRVERTRSVKVHWDRAWVDVGGTIFGDGPYLHVPITNYWGSGEETVHRVYPPARLRHRLQRRWVSMESATSVAAVDPHVRTQGKPSTRVKKRN